MAGNLQNLTNLVEDDVLGDVLAISTTTWLSADELVILFENEQEFEDVPAYQIPVGSAGLYKVWCRRFRDQNEWDIPLQIRILAAHGIRFQVTFTERFFADGWALRRQTYSKRDSALMFVHYGYDLW